ncbi:MAG: SDR family oxidoreductase [Candidatus Andersenbacteria bacterium]|nr:SDR family oxidoreductase [Candidatus Andersenbacteria bacterium]
MDDTLPRKVLVTGGAGYLGSVLVPLLLERGYAVHVLDALYFGDGGLSSVAGQARLRVTRDDILHQENLVGLFDDIDTVVHLASISNDPSCDLDPNLSIRTNFLATMALARRALADGVRQFIFASSCSVFGASGRRLLDETSRTGPATLYALTKLESERELLKLATPEFSVVVLRLATLFGVSPRMRFDLAVNTMAKHGVLGRPIVVNGAGAQYRPFVHVRDAAAAFAAVVRAADARHSGQIYNVGGDELNYTVADLAREVSAAFERGEVTSVASNTDVRSYRVAFRKIREALNFIPSRSILDGVREVQEAAGAGVFGDMDASRYYNLLVMKEIERSASVAPSLASTPRWSHVAKVPVGRQ